MKKIILLISMTLFVTTMFAEQTVYYVSSTGDDMLNTGLSPESPFQTIKKVFDIEVSPSINNDILINVASGTYPQSIITPNLNRAVKVTIAGQSASTTFIQNTGEFLNASTDNFRLFQLQPAENADLELIVKDVTIRNYGGTINNYAGCVVMMNGSGTGIKVDFTRCAFKNNTACRAAILQSSNGTYEVSFNSCYFENCKSFQYGTTTANSTSTNLDALIYITAGKLTVKNCIFNANKKDPLNSLGADRNFKKGLLMNIYPQHAKVTAIIVNNTIVNNKVESGKDVAVSIMPAISIMNHANGVDLTMLNNLFVENGRNGFNNDVDLYIDPVYVSKVAVAGNVLNKITTTDASEFLTTTTNSISSAYTCSSSEIDFDMEAGLPKVYLANNGINYVLAKGDSIVGGGISNDANSEVPIVDIRESTRKSAPDIGATDIYISGTLLNSQKAESVKIYTEGKALIARCDDGTGFSIKVSDITGRQLYASYVSSEFCSKVFNWTGILLVTIESKQGIVNRKVIL
ncbi:MAG: hypothetical protein VB102_08275 [Paludibacter sp.]|nr:hypothetical protein [Paludibacter sp.]